MSDMTTDVLYLAWNRLAFTQKTFEVLIENTQWEYVRTLVIYDDGSTDGTREWLQEQVELLALPCEIEMVLTEYGSPVSVMNHYIDHHLGVTWFAKIDNDVMVPGGWLEAMLDVLEASPELQLLGMEGGRSGIEPEGFDAIYSWEDCSHIGGVGIISAAFLGTTRRMKAKGRFGWTEHQREYKPVRGWITPDLQVCCLDMVPFEPWLSLSAEYVEKEWQRDWGTMHPFWSRWYWEWWAPDEQGEPE